MEQMAKSDKWDNVGVQVMLDTWMHRKVSVDRLSVVMSGI